MSADDNPSAKPADIGEALVEALGFEPTEGRKRGRRSVSADDLIDGAKHDAGFSVVAPSPDGAAAGDGALQALDEMAASENASKNSAAGSAKTSSGGGSSPSAAANGAAAASGGAAGTRNRSSASKKSKRRRNRNNNTRSKPGAEATDASSGRSGQRGAHDEIKFAAKPRVSTSSKDNPPPTADADQPVADNAITIAAPEQPAPPGLPSAETGSTPSGNGNAAPSGNGETAGAKGSPATRRPGRHDADPSEPPMAAAAAVTGELHDIVDLAKPDGQAAPPPPNAADAIAAGTAAARSKAVGGAPPTEQLDAVPTAPPAMPALDAQADLGKPGPSTAAVAAAAGAATAAAATAAATQAAVAKAAPTVSPSTDVPTAPGEPTPSTSAPKQPLELKGDVPEPAVQPAPVPTTPASGFDLGALPNVFRRKRRVQARKVRRVIRHIDPWSVLTFSVLFHLCVFAALLLASVLVWNAAEAAGTIENLEAFILELGDYETFEIKGDVVFRASVAIAGILTLASSVLLVLLTVVFNLISDLVGGIRLTVIEEETVRVRRKKQAS